MGNGNIAQEVHERLPDAVKSAVYALCQDYERRERLIEGRLLSRRTDLEFRYLNFKIKEAAVEVAGEAMAPVFIEEIGSKTGYAKSKLYYMSERIYKVQKSEIVLNIAKKLHLTD